MARNTILTIILNFRTPAMTLKAAEAALEEMEDLPGEVLIIDNGSGDGSFEALQAGAAARGWLDSGRLRIEASPVNGGFGAGMNIGFRALLSDGTRPDFFYLLNSDAFPEQDCISTLRDFLLKTSEAGLAGSYVHGEDGTPHCTLFRFPTIASEFEGAARTGFISRLLKHAIVPLDIPSAVQQVDWTAGASMMIRRNVIEAVGGFDETFFLYFEETELCHRAARAGWRTYYVPHSTITHVGSASTGMKTWARTPEFWLDSRLHYFTQSHGALYAVAATCARLLGGSIYGLRRLISDKPRADAPHFYGDLTRHHVKRALRPRPAPRPARPFAPDPVLEDNKS
ncbi:glycosyl transferase; group 2 family protein [Ruegeria sp. TM1040]|uniref:glycosyltransferase family 2 protein n=1 Tax=Ruegeria sp. (strain TM1040) TaxID=292414 RepID=UPI0000462E7D|nr:glycosyltransferase family 2 protein [Ruegeria sp. TM1040]ABF65133.1 glycosyl transferase; group 2 family protein [Ruegeria sp. TM1040]